MCAKRSLVVVRLGEGGARDVMSQKQARSIGAPFILIIVLRVLVHGPIVPPHMVARPAVRR